MATFLLVPGASLPGEAWADVATLLSDMGHAPVPVTLRGLGARLDEADAATDLHDHVADVVAALDIVDPAGPVVLVGHSYAAAVAWQAVAKVGDRLASVVCLGAVPPPAGSSMLDLMPPEGQQQVTAMVDQLGDGWRMPALTRDLVDLVFGDHGFDDASWARYASLATDHPFATMRTPLSLPLDADVTPRRVHVHCTGDPGPAPTLPPGWTQVELASGHWPMLTAPGALARLLHELSTTG